MKIQSSRHFFAKLAARRRLRLKANSTKFLVFSLGLGISAMGLSTQSARAASATWNVDADGAWNVGTNWSTGAAPGATTGATSPDIATFGTKITAARAVTVDTGRNILGIDFNANSSAYTLSGGSLLLTTAGYIQTSGGGSAHTDTVSSPITLAGDAAFNTNSTTVARILAIGSTVTGSAATGATSTLTLAGTGNSTSNNIAGAITDGANGGKLAVVKNDSGTWAFSVATNTFSGGLTVNGGTMRTSTTGNTTALFGTGTITLAGGQLNFGSTSGATFNNALVVNGSSSVLIRGNSTFNPTSMTGTGTLTVNNSNVSSGVGAATTFTSGGFQNFGGTVDIQSNANVAATTTLRLATAYTQNSLQNATLNLGDRSQLTQQASTSVGLTTTIGALSGTGTVGGGGGGAGTFTYSVGNKNVDSTFAGIIQNAATNPTALTKTGTGTLTLSGPNTYTGVTGVSVGGTLVAGNATALGTNASGTTVASGAALDVQANIGTEAIGVAGTGVSSSSGALITSTGTGTVGGTVTMTADTSMGGAGSLTVSGVIGGAFALTKVGAGTLTLSSSGNTYGGLTNVNAGTLNINGLFALGGGNYAGTTFNGGTLQYAVGTGGAFSTTFGGGDISNFGGVKPVTINTGGATIDTNNNAITFASPIGNNGTGALTKTGAGSLELQAANTYSGATAVSAGTLLLSTGSVNTSNAVSVASSGILTLGNATALSDTGALTLVSGATLNLNGAAGSSETIASLILNGVAEPAGTYSAADLMGFDGTINFGSTLGETLTIGAAAVPEPTTYLGGALLVGAACWSRRRRLLGGQRLFNA